MEKSTFYWTCEEHGNFEKETGKYCPLCNNKMGILNVPKDKPATNK